MSWNIKIIILGFALMLLGGFLFVGGSASQIDLPDFLGLMTYDLYIGFILIIIGLFNSPKK